MFNFKLPHLKLVAPLMMNVHLSKPVCLEIVSIHVQSTILAVHLQDAQ